MADPARIQNGLRIVFRSSAPRGATNGTEVVVGVAGAGGHNASTQSEPSSVARLETEQVKVNGFKRKLVRAKGLIEEQEFTGSTDQEDDLRLQVLLLQEENARLKAARHKPADPGSLIEEVRALADSSSVNDLLDETWSVLGECLALREGLDRACIEVQAAMTSVRERLSALGVKIDSLASAKPSDQRDEASLSA
jgi:hypothetical protein